MTIRLILLLVMFFGCLNVEVTFGQGTHEAEEIGMLKERIHALEKDVDSLREKSRGDGSLSIAFFLCGAVCALWAQNTGRNPWLWFFLGGILNVFALILLLTKNADDRFDRRVFGRTQRDRESMASRFGD